MKICTEIYDLDSFDAWSGAVDTKERIVDAGYGDVFMERLEELYPDGISDAKLNDILWFEEEFCYNLVGLNSHGVEPADPSGVAMRLDDWLDEFVGYYNKDNDTDFSVSELGISGDDFESSIEEWLEENQEDETDEIRLAEKWLDDGGREEIMEAIEEAAENLSEE